MSAPRCDLTELYVDQCAHCRRIVAETDYVERVDPVADFLAGPQILMGPWFPAAYPGACNQCGCRFDEDDQIRADGEGGWVAECCGQADEP